MQRRNIRIAAGAAAVGLAALAVAAGGPVGVALADTPVPPYLASTSPGYEVRALFSVADQVPLTGGGDTFQMVGTPDGLGAYANGDGTTTVLVNHELTQGTQSRPVLGGPTFRGSFVSELIVDADGDVLSGRPAFDSVYQENVLVGPAATTANTTPAFSRFCSASLAWHEEGFDRPIYLANEETEGPATFDGKGGQTVAIFDGQAHALPKMGRFSKENSLVMPHTGNRTVVISMEDGPATPDSQLWMYVGRKDRSPGAGVLSRNGLDNGALFVFRSTTPGMNDELSFQEGTISGEWLEVPGAGDMTDVQLEAAADALGAMTFIRPEDGAFSRTHKGEFYFDTTGGNAGAGNELGRVYTLRLNPGNPTQPALLHVAYNADHIVDAGGDVALSPDNLDVSDGFLMVQEDGTTQSRAVMGAKGRDGAIWAFPLSGGPWESRIHLGAREMVAELDPPGRDGTPVGPGVWESSGIIDASGLFGAGSWLVDVQAHSPTAAPVPGTVEDGQLLLLVPSEEPG